MNLHDIDPDEFPDREIDIDLPAIYKIHAPHTHERALEEIFICGCHYAWSETLEAMLESENKLAGAVEKTQQTEAELNALQTRYQALLEEKNALASKLAIKELYKPDQVY